MPHEESVIHEIDTMTGRRRLRIGIDGRVLMHYEIRGFARYTVELFRAMREILGHEIELYSFSPEPIASEFLAHFEIEPIVFQARREILWEQVELPKQLKSQNIDLFHATANRGIPYRRVCKYVVTCHDIIDRLPEFCGAEESRVCWRKKYADFVSRQRADRYITVSNFSKQDIVRFHGVAPDRVTVIYNAASPRFFDRVQGERIGRTRSKYSLPQQYFLYLGGFDKRKNVGALIDAFAHLPNDAPPLVLAGEHKWDFACVAEKVNTLGLSNRVICPGVIDDDDLPAIYRAALALVHPSRYEGFGLQIVEAMASGLPVLASATTSLPEILGGSGLLFDPDSPISIAQQMQRILAEPDLRTLLAANGQQRARFFSWRETAEQTLGLYRQLLGRNENTAYADEPALAAPGEQRR